MPTTKTNGTLSVTAYRGDAKTLLAFNLPRPNTARLAGFTIQAKAGPADKALVFDTKTHSGVTATGQKFTYRDAYDWLGFTARTRIFELLDEVVAKKSLRLDMFAYDLSEPDLIARLVTLAKQGRARVILDNAALHHDK